MASANDKRREMEHDVDEMNRAEQEQEAIGNFAGTDPDRYVAGELKPDEVSSEDQEKSGGESGDRQKD